jgi:hypothetical protein
MKKKEKSWNDISLKMAIELIQIQADDDLDLIVQRLSILNDQDPAEIEKMTFVEIEKEYSQWNFVGELPKQRNDATFKHEGVRYGRTNFGKMSLAQMVDIEEFYAAGFLDNIHNILTVLYLPVKRYNILTKKYTLESYEFDFDRAESFKNISFDFVYGNLLFFWTIARIYTSNMRDYLIAKNQEKMTEVAQMLGLKSLLDLQNRSN